MAAATPMRDVRRVPFAGTSTPRLSVSALPPSPYTPFSGRRSGSVPAGTPVVATRARAEGHGVTSISFRRPESAEDFVRGGLDGALRAVSVDVVAAVAGKRGGVGDDDDGFGFVREMVVAVEVQMDFAVEFMEDRGIHPYIRRQVSDLYDALRLERETWMLVETAWRSPEIRPKDLCGRRLSPDILQARLLEAAPSVAKCQRIVEWLETVAHQQLERAGGPRVKPLDDPAYRWEYTAAARNGEPLSMDFPLQDENVLDEVENNAEERLSRELFRLVRAGQLEEAEEICRRVGQPWRAAVLAGGKRCSAMSADGRKGGARQTWRSAAAAMARSASTAIPAHERAICGILCGVLEPVLAVATTFEDQAWARLTVAVDGALDRAVSDQGGGAMPITDNAIIQAFSECDGAAEGVDAVNGTVLSQVRAVRAYLSLGPGISAEHRHAMLDALAALAKTGLEQQTEWVCRFAAHICVFLKLSGGLAEIGEDGDEIAAFEFAVESYARLVIQKDLEDEARATRAGTILGVRPLVCELAARHLAELASPDRVVDVFADLLCAALRADMRHEHAESKRVGVTPPEINDRRTVCLQKAGQCFDRETLDSLVLVSVDRIWDEHLPVLPEDAMPGAEYEDDTATPGNYDDITESDELVVRAIEFLIFPAYPNYKEAVMRGTCAARCFFLSGKQAAARHLVTWFPAEVLQQLSPGACRSAIHELDCWRVYMDAVARHAEWNAYYFSQRPSALPQQVRDAASALPGVVSYEVQAAANIQLERYVNEMETYERISSTTRDAAVEGLRSALLFNGGWMRDLSENYVAGEEVVDANVERRQHEIRIVRRTGVPQLAALLHHVLHESRLYNEATSLACTIADDSLRLYECFSGNDLRALLTRIADSAISLADDTVKRPTRHPYDGTFFEEFT